MAADPGPLSSLRGPGARDTPHLTFERDDDLGSAVEKRQGLQRSAIVLPVTGLLPGRQYIASEVPYRGALAGCKEVGGAAEPRPRTNLTPSRRPEDRFPRRVTVQGARCVGYAGAVRNGRTDRIEKIAKSRGSFGGRESRAPCNVSSAAAAS